MRTLNGVMLSLGFTLSLAAGAASAAPPPPSHPILGIWRLTLPDGSCSETYRFRGDGTTLVTSAEEVSESRFEIPSEPSANGFYKLKDTITKVNGKKDCSGAVMTTRPTVTHYIQFHPSGKLFLMCMQESLDACIGPFERIEGQGT
jgi:hypothetical protein